jgi:hypothetical protein
MLSCCRERRGQARRLGGADERGRSAGNTDTSSLFCLQVQVRQSQMAWLDNQQVSIAHHLHLMLPGQFN